MTKCKFKWGGCHCWGTPGCLGLWRPLKMGHKWAGLILVPTRSKLAFPSVVITIQMVGIYPDHHANQFILTVPIDHHYQSLGTPQSMPGSKLPAPNLEIVYLPSLLNMGSPYSSQSWWSVQLDQNRVRIYLLTFIRQIVKLTTGHLELQFWYGESKFASLIRRLSAWTFFAEPLIVYFLFTSLKQFFPAWKWQGKLIGHY